MIYDFVDVTAAGNLNQKQVQISSTSNPLLPTSSMQHPSSYTSLQHFSQPIFSFVSETTRDKTCNIQEDGTKYGHLFQETHIKVTGF